MKKLSITIIVSALMILLISITAGAEEADAFQIQSASYGLNNSQYISSYEGYSQIFCPGQDAATYTNTNVRSLPDAASDAKTTLEAATGVKIWGFTDTGWSYVFFTGEDGQACCGYIRSDLLEPVNAPADPKNPEQAASE